MKLHRIAVVALALLAACTGPRVESPPDPGVPAAIEWQDWSDGVFSRAQAEHRLVLLHLGTQWCHWCHVMEKTTYEDRDVVSLVRASYLAVHVDADLRPDLANRYEDYGWPATIIFDATGHELVKWRGYIAPERMRSLLAGVVADPTPGPSATAEPDPVPADTAALASDVRAELEARYLARYDRELGSWGRSQKYLDPDCVELSLLRAQRGDRDAEAMARKTLDAEQRSLVDPVWGGVYQYSDGGVWENPHFEKIMSRQAADLETYALASEQWGDPAYMKAARDVERYLTGFLLGPDGAFYTSQDADLEKGKHAADYFAKDDAGRRAQGLPAIDHHVYARENGWAISALVALHAATADPSALERAETAANKVIETRALPGGGFRHDETDASGPYLGDTLAMGRAFLDLAFATGDPAWLDRSRQAARFVLATFRGGAGFATAASRGALPSGPEIDENVALVRWLRLLHVATPDPAFQEGAEHAMRYLASPEVALRGMDAGILLADRDMREEPLHVTIQGKKEDPRTRALFAAARRLPVASKVLELQETDGPPAALVCGNGACLPPVRDPADLPGAVARVR